MGTRTYPIEVDESLWEDYKDTVPRSQNLDDPIIDFLERRVERQKGESNHQ